MKREKRSRSDEEMRHDYPIAGRVPNWYFRAIETSNNAWLVEGCDVWGRKVSRQGADPDKLLDACIEDAGQIREQSRDHGER